MSETKTDLTGKMRLPRRDRNLAVASAARTEAEKMNRRMVKVEVTVITHGTVYWKLYSSLRWVTLRCVVSRATDNLSHVTPRTGVTPSGARCAFANRWV